MTRLAGDAPFEGYTQGKYVISFEGVYFGSKALEEALTENCDFIVIDEVGPLELKGDGLTQSVEACISSVLNLAIVVRSSLFDTFLEYFGRDLFQGAIIVDAVLLNNLYKTSHLPTMEKGDAHQQRIGVLEAPTAEPREQVDPKHTMSAANPGGWDPYQSESTLSE